MPTITSLKPRVVACATFFAATGQRHLALALLDLLKDEPFDVEVERLRGKIHAQLRNYDEAITIWEAARKEAPQDEGLVAAIRKANEFKAAPGRSHGAGGPVVLAVAFALVLLLLGGVYLLKPWKGHETKRAEESHLATLGPDLRKIMVVAVGEALAEDHRRAADQLTGLQKEIASLKTSAEMVSKEQVQSITNQLTGLQDQAQKISAQLAVVDMRADGRLGGVEGRMAGLETNQVRLETLQVITNRSLETMAADISHLNAVLTGYESWRTKLLMQIERTRPPGIDSLANKLERARRSLAQAQKEQRDFHAKSSPNSQHHLMNLEGRTRSLENDVDTLQKQLEQQPWVILREGLNAGPGACPNSGEVP